MDSAEIVYIAFYVFLLSFPLFAVHKRFFRKAPIFYVDNLLQGKVYLSYRMKNKKEKRQYV